jgi:intracellular multiplication protein IcmC
MKYSRNIFVSVACVCLMLLTAEAYASSVTDAKTMLVNISRFVPDFWRMITAGAYMLGILFIFKAFYKLKIYGEARAMMASQSSVKEPATYILVGSALMYYPTMRDRFMSTIFGDDSVLKYSDWAGPNSVKGYSTEAIFMIVQLIGLIAFFRGWILLSNTATQGGQPGTFGKALTHIFGGVLAMNIVGTLNILQTSLGVSFF